MDLGVFSVGDLTSALAQAMEMMPDAKVLSYVVAQPVIERSPSSLQFFKTTL